MKYKKTNLTTVCLFCTQENRNLPFMRELRYLFALLFGSKRKYVDPSRAVEILKDAFKSNDSQQVMLILNRNNHINYSWTKHTNMALQFLLLHHETNHTYLLWSNIMHYSDNCMVFAPINTSWTPYTLFNFISVLCSGFSNSKHNILKPSNIFLLDAHLYQG